MGGRGWVENGDPEKSFHALFSVHNLILLRYRCHENYGVVYIKIVFVAIRFAQFSLTIKPQDIAISLQYK